MEEIGLVIAKNEKRKQVTVSFERKAECEGCKMCARGSDKMTVKCVIENSLNADIGDSVKVNMGAGFVLSAAAIVYLIPLFLSGITLFLSRSLKEELQITLVSTMLIVSGAIIYLIDRFAIRKKKNFRPTMVEIVSTKFDPISTCRPCSQDNSSFSEE